MCGGREVTQVCAVLLKETNLSVILDNREKNELKLIVLQ